MRLDSIPKQNKMIKMLIEFIFVVFLHNNYVSAKAASKQMLTCPKFSFWLCNKSLIVLLIELSVL